MTCVEVFHDSLRRICRCSEMVQRTSCQLSVNRSITSGCNVGPRHSLDLSSVQSDDGNNSPYSVNSSGTNFTEVPVIFQPEQAESIQQAVESVTQATVELCNALRRKLTQQDALSESTSLTTTASTSAHSNKRMLPVVPGSAVDSAVTGFRCQSARCSDRRLSMLSKHISLMGFQSRKSNEI